MAKTSLVKREAKRRKTVARCAEKRKALKAIISDINSTDEQRYEAMMALQKMPRNSSPSRLRNRCSLSGRARGVYRKFALSRSMIRLLAMKGEVPGLVKSSW